MGMRPTNFLVACASGLMATLALMPAVNAQPWVLTKVADTNTPVPGGTGNFGIPAGIPFTAPSYGGGSVVFWGRSGTLEGMEGIYGNQGGTLNVVADRNTIAPGSNSTFSNFPSFTGVSTDGSAPSFYGVVSGAGYGAIFSRIGSQLVPVVRTDTLIPSGTGTFGGTLGFPSRDGASLTFIGGTGSVPNSGSRGVYRAANGQVNVVVDTNTPLPQGGGNFAGFGRQGLSGDQVVFMGEDSAHRGGVYSVDLQGTLPVSVIADTNTPRPGGQGNFNGFGSPSIDGGNVAFIDRFMGLEQGAVYARINGILQPIAVPGTVLPGGGVLSACGAVAISGDSVAFTAVSNAESGIYVWRNGVIQNVIRAGGTLGGLQVASFHLSPEAFEGDTLAFAFQNINANTGGVYTATIPAPAALTLLGLASVMKSRRSRRA